MRKFCGRPGCYASYYCGCDQPKQRSKAVLLPQDIMMKISQHYADHMEQIQIAAEADDLERCSELRKRHDNFKLNVNKLLDVHMQFAHSTQDIKVPNTNLFSITIHSLVEPVFADYIGKHTKLLVARWDDVYTCLYSLNEWEEEHDPLS